MYVYIELALAVLFSYPVHAFSCSSEVEGLSRGGEAGDGGGRELQREGDPDGG